MKTRRVTIDVLANDSFGPNASVTGVGTATSGTVEIVNGEVKYTPNEDFNGSDTFTYTVTTAAGDTETDNVSVTVNAQGDIVADTAITDEDTAVTIDVLANDSFGPNASVTGVGTATSGTVEIVNGEVKYTPNEDFNGSDTFTYTVTTAAGDTETDNVSVTVNAQGDIVADTAITDEDTAVTIDVLANDSFGPNASVTGVGTATSGTVEIVNGEVKYTPNEDFNGSDTFTYTVTTAAGDTETDNVSVTVNAQGDIVADTAITDEDTAVTIDVLANDSFGPNASVTGVGTATSGTVEIVNGEVKYTPNEDFNGSDTFTYTVTTAAGDTETDNVSVTVNAQGDIVADTAITDEDTAVTIDVLANDSFGPNASVTGVGTATSGTVEIVNGEVKYTPNEDFNGSDTFTYTVTTAAGDTETDNVSVTVNAQGDIVADTAITDEDTAVTIDVLANDSFGPNASVTGVGTATSGTVEIVNGEVKYTPNEDFNGSDTFTYTVTTAAGDTETDNVSVTVNAQGDIVADTAITDEDTAVTIDVLANDSFGPNASVTGVGTATSGTVEIVNGEVKYTPNEDFNGSDTFTYTVTTAAGDTETDNVSVTVNAQGDIVADTAITDEDTAVTIDVLANDSFGPNASVTGVGTATSGTVEIVNGEVKYTPNEDFNGSDTFTYTVTTAAGDTETDNVSVTVNAQGDIVADTAITDEDTAVTIDVLANDSFGPNASVTGVGTATSGTVEIVNGEVKYTPNEDFNGSDTFTYTVTTAAGDTETDNVSVTVNAQGDIVADTAITDEDTAVTIDVLANDSFGPNASVTGVGTATSGTVEIVNGEVKYTPNEDFNGSDTFTYTVTTAAGDTETDNVSVTVNAQGDIVADTAITDEDTAVTIDVLANDSFGPNASVTGVGTATSGTVEIVNGEVKYTPNEDFNGSDTFTYTVTTAAGDTETDNVSVTVNAQGDIVADTAITDEDTAVTIDVLANDSFGPNASVTGVGTATSGTVEIVNGEVKYTPNEDFNGSDTFTYTVTTAAGDTETDNVSVTVNAQGDIVADTAITDEDTAVTIDVLANDSFGPNASVTGVGTATSGTVEIVNGEVKYTPNEDFNGSDTFTYTVTTAAGDTETDNVSVTVNAQGDIVADTAITDEDTAVTIDVLANDSFGPNASVTGVGTATSGTVEIVNGEVKYTPNEDFNGSDTFTYTVTTAAGDTETDNVSVTVNAQGDIVADTAITDEDTAVTIDVLANDSFGPNASVTGVGTATSGTVEIVNGEVKYTPNEDFNGSDTFTYTVTTAAGDTETDNVSVTVNAQGDIVADTAITDEDTAVTIDVLANDSFGPNASVTGVGTATSGTVEIVNGEVKYTPNEDFNGSDTFTYTVTTAAGDTETDNVSVTVNAQGDIVADTAITDEDTAVTIDVLANDSFGPNASVTGVGTATSGTVEIVNGEVKYTPNEDFNGSDTFTYTVTTAAGDTETDNVSVTVNAQGDIVADTAITDEDTAVTIDVLANDSFGPNASVTGVGTATSGTVEIVNGEVKYTPNEDFNGSDTFTYTVTTAAGDTETDNVSVTVNAQGDIVADTAITDEDTAVTIDVLANDSFGPNASVTGVGTATSGTVEIVNGEVKYTPNEDFNGSDTFTYTVTTAAGDTETDNVSVTVNAQGDIVADTAITDEDTAVTIDVLANDSFGPNASVTGVGTATSGTVEIVNGEVKYTPNEDFNGSDTFTYTVTTAAGDTETDNVSVSVNAVGTLSIDPVATYVDPDNAASDVTGVLLRYNPGSNTAAANPVSFDVTDTPPVIYWVSTEGTVSGLINWVFSDDGNTVTGKVGATDVLSLQLASDDATYSVDVINGGTFYDPSISAIGTNLVDPAGPAALVTVNGLEVTGVDGKKDTINSSSNVFGVANPSFDNGESVTFGISTQSELQLVLLGLSADGSTTVAVTVTYSTGIDTTGNSSLTTQGSGIADWIDPARTVISIKIVNQGGSVGLTLSDVAALDKEDLILQFRVEASDTSSSVKNTIAVGLDQDSTPDVIFVGLNKATVIDGVVVGMSYSTSSGIAGATDFNGTFKYGLGDTVTFSIGSVVVGTISAASALADGKLFLQEIAGVGLENITDDYVEKLAIFLQTLDNDGNAYNGIVITDEMHALFSDDNFDLEVITKEELVQLLLDNGLTPVDEDEAIQHVKDMITEHAGVTEFEEDDNDSISLLGDDEGLDLAWSLADPEEPVDGMYLSDEADQVSLEIGDLLGDGIPDSDLSQYISVASDGLNTVIEVNSAGIGNTEGGASRSYTLEGVDLTTDTNGNALDTDSMNELLRNLYNGANDTGLM